MITRVDSVLIADKVVSAMPANVGELAVFDENRKAIAAADAANAKTLYFGVCTGKVNVTLKDGSVEEKPVIKYGQAIQKASKPHYVKSTFEAPVAAKIEFDFTDAEIVAGHRYAIRIAYLDLYEHPGQFTHTYDAIADSADVAELVEKLKKAINKHPNRRVNVVVEGAKLIVTAMDKDDNEGVNSLNEYSIVSMVGSVYHTDPHALTGAMLDPVPGVVINNIEGKPGVGYWKQVRDVEARALGYEGKIYTDAYPTIEGTRYVKEGTEYDVLTVENDNLYLSPDNQYIKTTPLRNIIFVAKGAGIATIATALDNFNAVVMD